MMMMEHIPFKSYMFCTHLMSAYFPIWRLNIITCKLSYLGNIAKRHNFMYPNQIKLFNKMSYSVNFFFL